MELAITTHPSAERYLIAVEGEIDISNADKLRNAIDLALEQPTERVELDFSQVPYIDSTGIGVLVGAARRASERERALSITGAQPNVLRVMELAITTHPSAERYLIAVEGEIDISNADKLRNAIDLALEQPTERVELEFSQDPKNDSTRSGVRVGAARRASERVRGLSITGAQPNVLRVAQLLGVDKVISISAA